MSLAVVLVFVRGHFCFQMIHLKCERILYKVMEVKEKHAK